MANVLEISRIGRQVEALRLHSPEMVPVDCDTSFVRIAYGTDLANEAPSSSLSVRAYVVGLELLGHRFYVAEDDRGQGLYIMEPEHTLPEAWSRRRHDLYRSFSGSTGEVIAFLLERDGGPTLQRYSVGRS